MHLGADDAEYVGRRNDTLGVCPTKEHVVPLKRSRGLDPRSDSHSEAYRGRMKVELHGMDQTNTPSLAPAGADTPADQLLGRSGLAAYTDYRSEDQRACVCLEERFQGKNRLAPAEKWDIGPSEADRAAEVNGADRLAVLDTPGMAFLVLLQVGDAQLEDSAHICTVDAAVGAAYRGLAGSSHIAHDGSLQLLEPNAAVNLLGN